MILYVEVWSVRQAWLDLTVEERGAYCEQVGQAVGGLLAKGAEIVGWSINDPDVDRRFDRPYFAVWKFPSQELVKEFEALVEAAGWHTYFEQVNVAGAAQGPQEVLAHAVALT